MLIMIYKSRSVYMCYNVWIYQAMTITRYKIKPYVLRKFTYIWNYWYIRNLTLTKAGKQKESCQSYPIWYTNPNNYICDNYFIIHNTKYYYIHMQIYIYKGSPTLSFSHLHPHTQSSPFSLHSLCFFSLLWTLY